MSRPKHHIRQEECASRAPYREGKHPKAVKVYTVNQESQYLLVQGVPTVGATQELVKLCSMHGDIHEHRALDDYPAEQFIEVYLFKYKRIQAARHAKRKLDGWSFYGGVLHVCYAPEYESEQETRWKLQERRRAVAAKTRQYDRDGTYTSTKGQGQSSGATATLSSAYPESISHPHLTVSPHSSSNLLYKNELIVNQSAEPCGHDFQTVKQNNRNETSSYTNVENRTFVENKPIPGPNRNIDMLRVPENYHSIVNNSANSAHIEGNQSNHGTYIDHNQSNHRTCTEYNQSHSYDRSNRSWNQSNISKVEAVNRIHDNGCDQNTKCETDDTQQLILPLPPKEKKTGIAKHHRQQEFHFAKVPTAQAEFPVDFDARLERDVFIPSSFSDDQSKFPEKDKLGAHVEKAEIKSMQEKINENVKKTTDLVIRAVSKPRTAPKFIPRQTQAKMVPKVSAVTVKKTGEPEEVNKDLRRNAFMLRAVQGPEVCREDAPRKPDSQEVSVEKSRKDIRKRISEVSNMPPQMKKWKKTEI